MPKFDLTDWGPVTVLLVALTVIAALAGALVCIIHPDTLTFEALLNDLEKFAVALGLLGIGRGVATGAKHIATARVQADDPSYVADLTDRKGAHPDPENVLEDKEFPDA